MQLVPCLILQGNGMGQWLAVVAGMLELRTLRCEANVKIKDLIL
jgi:hypothetical protein